jgi:hypothetical protein
MPVPAGGDVLAMERADHAGSSGREEGVNRLTLNRIALGGIALPAGNFSGSVDFGYPFENAETVPGHDDHAS